MTTNDTWYCPLCDTRLPYGTGCPDDWRTCERGVKNIMWRMKAKRDDDPPRPIERGIGISEISNESTGGDE